MDIDRFWCKVELSGIDECWNWKAGCNSNGYGKFYIKNITYRAHRISWTLHYGSIPTTMNVLHACDNKKCVNPKHLFLGTQKENIQDAIKKGRFKAGQYQNKLKPCDVATIRKEYKFGVIGYKLLAKKYNVTRTTIRNIVLGITWRNR